MDFSNTEPKLIVLFWIGISSGVFGVGSNREGNLISRRPTSEDEIEGTKCGLVKGVTKRGTGIFLLDIEYASIMACYFFRAVKQ